jgi:hypothetical protein
MSPSCPPTSSKLPNDSAYAVTTHCRSLVEKPSDCWADGSAMFTIVPSSTTISCNLTRSLWIGPRSDTNETDQAVWTPVGEYARCAFAKSDARSSAAPASSRSPA